MEKHNVTIHFNGNTKIIDSEKALELFTQMLEKVRAVKTQGISDNFNKMGSIEKIQIVINGINAGYKTIWDDGRHTVVDKPIYGVVDLNKTKRYVIIDATDEDINAIIKRNSKLCKDDVIEETDDLEEAKQLYDKIVEHNKDNDKKYGTRVALIDISCSDVNSIIEIILDGSKVK